jgi:hypothetical protein
MRDIMAKRISKPPPAEDEARSATVAVRLKPSIKRALDAVSKSERRTVSAMLEIVVEDWLRERGALK